MDPEDKEFHAKWFAAILEEQKGQTKLLGKINSTVQIIGVIIFIAAALSICNALMVFMG